ncbi:2-hydroxycarboxylate transporter family protein [Arthrobacter sp. NIO-1057]|uniref:2-hydroxycarboxylate transporter family protein n=1 Tax=Arthrobacter sp. NIO-1057 TaxID=993071 RepID=UPI00071C66EA|nr:2-hydroxycarboxylate transporter family protein [Arthrobacter sp. NIO-1057]KSU66831.1 malate permease [Arthrobacter sp. NIO-1057]
MDFDIGIIPAPVFIGLVLLLIAFSTIGMIPQELAMVIAIMTVGAFTLGEVGKRLPVIKHIGGAAIIVTILPSFLNYLGVFPEQMTAAVGDFFSSSKILNLFIAAVIVGSILAMNRVALIKGFAKIFVPLLTGTICALTLGMISGTLLGLGAKHTLFFIVAPIMAGGVGEGAIPLTIGYSSVLDMSQGEALAMVLPPIMVGNVSAVLGAGILAFIAKRKPNLTGNGELQPGGHKDITESALQKYALSVQNLAAAGMVAIFCYLCGVLTHELLGWPAPIVMLGIAIALTLLHGVSPRLRDGANGLYKLAITALAFPILFTFSMVMTPWESLVAGFAPANLITCVLTVVGMIGGGYLGALWVRLHPIDTAVVVATHSGMGGAGDLAILASANRMSLMPFAQIATRIGGAITVVLALIAVGPMLG